jgi:hypothetical protein
MINFNNLDYKVGDWYYKIFNSFVVIDKSMFVLIFYINYMFLINYLMVLLGLKNWIDLKRRVALAGLILTDSIGLELSLLQSRLMSNWVGKLWIWRILEFWRICVFHIMVECRDCSVIES